MAISYPSLQANGTYEQPGIGQARGYDWERECAHTLVAPDVLGLGQDSLQPAQLRQRCPDCRRPLELRVWQPTAGGWYVAVREIGAAGRRWSWRYDGLRWRMVI